VEICDYVEKAYNKKYTVAGMTNWLKRSNFTYRKPHGFPLKANTDEQKAFVKKYEELKKSTPKEESIVFLDAVHSTMATKISYGWIKKKSDKTRPVRKPFLFHKNPAMHSGYSWEIFVKNKTLFCIPNRFKDRSNLYCTCLLCYHYYRIFSIRLAILRNFGLI
jgi:hypothetical protein